MGPVVDAFGLVIHCREPGGNHPLLPMTVHTLQQAISPGEPIYPACMQFTMQDYKEVRLQTFLWNCVSLMDLLTSVPGNIIVHHILCISVQSPRFSHPQLLGYAQSLKVDMSTEAEMMIHGYYMASRRVRSSVSVTSIKLL